MFFLKNMPAQKKATTSKKQKREIEDNLSTQLSVKRFGLSKTLIIGICICIFLSVVVVGWAVTLKDSFHSIALPSEASDQTEDWSKVKDDLFSLLSDTQEQIAQVVPNLPVPEEPVSELPQEVEDELLDLVQSEAQKKENLVSTESWFEYVSQKSPIKFLYPDNWFFSETEDGYQIKTSSRDIALESTDDGVEGSVIDITIESFLGTYQDWFVQHPEYSYEKFESQSIHGTEVLVYEVLEGESCSNYLLASFGESMYQIQYCSSNLDFQIQNQKIFYTFIENLEFIQ